MHGHRRSYLPLAISLQRLSAIVAAVTLIALSSPSEGGSVYDDTFDAGIDPHMWDVLSNQPLYTVDDTHGDVRLSKVAGGTYTFQYVNLQFARKLRGDFDVSVDFRNASINRIDGKPGNQVQLNILAADIVFSAVRSDEEDHGHNYHVYCSKLGPSYWWCGETHLTATNGTLRVVRAGEYMTGYFNATTICSEQVSDEDATMWLSLQNNGTKDPTAVIYDNVHVEADRLLPSPTSLKNPKHGESSFGFTIAGLTCEATNEVQRSIDLTATNGWTNIESFVSKWGDTNWSGVVGGSTSGAFYRVLSR